jgi:hypothetical protein
MKEIELHVYSDVLIFIIRYDLEERINVFFDE